MLLGIGLILLQMYLFIVAVTRRDPSGAVGTLIVVLVALLIVVQIATAIRFRGSSRESASYPVAFVGLVVSASLLAPLLISPF